MKKLMLSLSLVTGLGLTATAQNPVKFGVKAGVTFPNMTVSAMGTSISFDSKTSFYAGATADIPVSNIFSVQPGLILNNKGTKINSGFDFSEGSISTNGSGTLNFMYIEVPVNLIANLSVGNSGKVFLGAGPYYAMAIDAYAKYAGVKEDIEIGSGDENFKRSDFGLNFLAGYQLNNGLNIHAGYGLGLSSVIPDQEIDMKLKNKAFSIGLGFTF
jgi:hypothetical protein